MFDFVSILPSHSTNFERALERASAWVTLTADPVRVWDPDKCPEELLPWLAWALSVDNWRSDWPVETKRSVIRNSIEIHRRKGTIGSIRRALDSVGFAAEIVEARDDPRLAPKSFHLVSVFPESATLTATSLSDGARDAREAVKAVKPASVGFDLSIGQSIPAPRLVAGDVHSRMADTRTPRVSVSAEMKKAIASRIVGHIRHSKTILRASGSRGVGISMFTRMEAL